ncbi:MAG: Lrp/AsnC ligand binding domain-containing protein [Conexivisphaera sp.]
MRTAIFITTTGFPEDVFRAVRRMAGVEEAHLLIGVYDIVAIVSAEDEAGLKRIASRIRAVPGVMTTTTFLYMT